jgi:hypothetical protein
MTVQAIIYLTAGGNIKKYLNRFNSGVISL